MEDNFPKESLTDEAIVELVKNDDESAYQILVKRYASYIFNFVRQYAPHKEDAEDITQDTFLKAWKHIKTFKKEKKFKTWLFTIARNVAIDYTKKKRSLSFSDMESGNDEDAPTFAETLSDAEPLPPEIFERSEIAAELAGALDTLHPDHRSTLVMHYRDEMTFEEIAEILGKPMNTVKSWHRRALAKVHDMLLHRKPL